MIHDELSFPELPDSWARISLEDSCSIRPQKIKIKAKSYLKKGLLPVVDQGSSLIGGYTNDLAAQMAVKLPVVVFGDHTRAIKYIDIPFAAGADGIKVLEPSEIYDPKAFYWFVSAIRLPEKGYARHFQYLRASDMPLPPLNEQRRIAAKLDTTLASVDSCRQRLEGVATLIKRFRQAVLEAATTGELTREWREEHGHKYDWQQRRLADVAEARLGKMLDQAKNFGEPTPYLRNVNVRWFAFDLSDIQLMRLAPEERSELDVCNGDLLVCEGGEPGRCAVWRDPDSNITFQKALHRVRTGADLLPDFLAYCLRSQAESGRLSALFTGTTIKHLTGKSLASFVFMLPPREEQAEIINRSAVLFSLADQLEAKLTAARQVVERLTPALLAKAFCGELVPQDPCDEPASELLARIRAARQADASASKPSRRGRMKAAAPPEASLLDAAPAPPDLLATLLRECGALSSKALLAASELEPDRFVAQLELEMQAGRIRQLWEDGEQLWEVCPR